MKKILITFLALSGMYFSAFAQRQPDYVSKFDTKIEAVILDNLSGNVIVKEADKISAFNPQTNLIEWTVTDEQIGKMSDAAKLQKLKDFSKDPDLLKIFQSTDKIAFIANTPYIQANVNSNDVIINSVDGKILFNSATKSYRTISSQYIPGDEKFLFLATEGKDFKCILYDLKTGNDIWSTAVGTRESMLKTLLANKLNESMGIQKMAKKDEVIPAPNAFYATVNNTLYKLDKETGAIKWLAHGDVHRFYLTNDLNHIITLRDASNMVSTKRAVNVINTENGAPIFPEEITTKRVSYIEDWGDKFLIAHSNGFNFFDYATGKKIWKKDAKGDDIKQVIPIDNDYLYIADNEMSLIDKDGKQKWKNFIEISDDKADPVYFLNKVDNNKVFYLTGTYGNMVDYTTGKKVWKGNIKFEPKLPLLYAYDEEAKSFLVFNAEKLYRFDPNAEDKPEAFAKVKVKDDKSLSSLALFDWGISLSGEYEVIGVGKDGSTIFHNLYKEPGEAGRRIMKTLGMAGQGAAGYMAVNNELKYASKSLSGNAPSESKMRNERLGTVALASGFSALTDKFRSRFKALKQNGDFAFIFARGEGDQSNYIVKVRKSDGEEIDKVAIDNIHPLYEVDYVTNNLYYVYQNELRVFSKK